MSYLALYRKYRPQTFSEVVGQDHVVRTLRNALSSGRVSHAYLFSGTRGTGKTTMAKLLAKTLNCTDLQEGEPCNRCARCVRINEGSFMDILEIDAASNRGIDEIRELREKINLSPAEGDYKVFIIDEVHMLTPEAFNALLKTLEEPPEHAIFILATTEPHKIPMTILSRCQRYDFHRIPVDDIAERLADVATRSGHEAEEAALRLIAKMAAGGLRDALGMMDQCLTSADGVLRAERVADVIGISAADFLYDLVEAMRAGQTAKALSLLQGALQQGKQSGQILRDLIQYLRDLLVLQLGEDGFNLVGATREQAERMKDQGGRIGQASILQRVEELAPLQNRMKYEGDGQLLLEVEIIRMSRRLAPNGEAKEAPVVRAEQAEQETPVQKDPQQAKPAATPGREPAPAEAGSEPPEHIESPPSTPASPAVQTQDAERLWERVLALLKDRREIKTLAFVKEGTPSVSDGRLVLRFEAQYAFHKTNADKPECRHIVSDALCEVCGAQMPFAVAMEEERTEDEEPEEDMLETVQRIFGKDKIKIVEDE